MTKTVEGLYEQYFQRLVTSIARKGVDYDSALDIASDIFVLVIDRPDLLSSEDDARQFLFGKAKFAVMRYKREQKNRAVIKEVDQFGNENDWDESVSALASDVPLFTPTELERKEEYRRLRADPERYAIYLQKRKEWFRASYNSDPEKYRRYWRDYYHRNRSYLAAKSRLRNRKRIFKPKYIQFSRPGGSFLVARRTSVIHIGQLLTCNGLHTLKKGENL